MDAFAVKVGLDVATGKLDSRDMPLVLATRHRWHLDLVWTGRRHHRNGMSEYGTH